MNESKNKEPENLLLLQSLFLPMMWLSLRTATSVSMAAFFPLPQHLSGLMATSFPPLKAGLRLGLPQCIARSFLVFMSVASDDSFSQFI